MPNRPKSLILFSGGLDSILAVKLLQEQGVTVQAVHFTCPFYSSEWARRSAKNLGIRLHEVPVDQAYFRMVANPQHGHGSNMNPCIDCKAYMLRRAENLRKSFNIASLSRRGRKERIDFFLATGEVVGERPLSQTKHALILIEKLAGLSRSVVRPLSGRLLPPTTAEEKGFIDRDKLLAIHGRSRKPQLSLARKYKIREYPAPAGGCLLTDTEYSRRLREALRYNSVISWDLAELLKLGRHFRSGKTKIVVGRNKEDNDSLLPMARRLRLPRLEVVGHPGPLTAIVSRRPSKETLETAASLTVRYSDTPGKVPARVRMTHGRVRKILEAKPLPNPVLEKMMV